MKTDPLLDAVFSPGEESLRPVIKAARRRRIRRVMVRVAGVAACVAAASWYGSPQRSSPHASSVAGISPAPVPRSTAGLVIVTASGPAPIISSRPLAASEVIHTSLDSVVLVSTEKTPSTLTNIADSELLALLEPGRAALVADDAGWRLVNY